MSAVISFDCGICLDKVDSALYPTRASYATFMPCCNFPIHLRCVKLSFNETSWKCPSCRSSESLKSSESRARFITYLYLRSNFIEGESRFIDSNLRLIKMLFLSHFSSDEESSDEESKSSRDIFEDVKPIPHESDDKTRERFIHFYDYHVKTNPILERKLGSFFERIFLVIERARSSSIAVTFRNFEVATIEDNLRELDATPIKLERNRCEDICICLAYIALAATAVAFITIALRKYT